MYLQRGNLGIVFLNVCAFYAQYEQTQRDCVLCVEFDQHPFGQVFSLDYSETFLVKHLQKRNTKFIARFKLTNQIMVSIAEILLLKEL